MKICFYLKFSSAQLGCLSNGGAAAGFADDYLYENQMKKTD